MTIKTKAFIAAAAVALINPILGLITYWIVASYRGEVKK